MPYALRMARDQASNSHEDHHAALILSEARRSLDGQVELISQLRSRAASLVGFASLVTTALGFTARTGATDAWAWVGLAFFFTVLALALFVIGPRTFSFALRPSDIERWLEMPATAPQNPLLLVARRHEANYDSNMARIARMQAAVFWAMVGLGAESALLALSVAF